MHPAGDESHSGDLIACGPMVGAHPRPLGRSVSAWPVHQRRAQVGGDVAQPIEGFPVQLDMENLGDDLCPAVQEVEPPILNQQTAVGTLGHGLVPEVQFAPVVYLPGDPPSREETCVCNR